MNSGNWCFRPKWVTSLIALAGLLILLALGNWQLDRAHQKQVLYDQYRARGNLPTINLNRWITRDTDAVVWRRVRVSGRYHKHLQILLDNQMHQGRFGYDVFTPMRIDGFGEWVLVNRGWVPASEYRSVLPAIKTPAGDVTVTGVIKRPLFSGIVLNKNYIEKLPGGVLRTQSINLPRLEKETGITLLPYIVRLDPASPTGFVRHWQVAGSGKERNLGYAFQWFMMAAVVVFIYFYLNIKRTNP